VEQRLALPPVDAARVDVSPVVVGEVHRDHPDEEEERGCEQRAEAKAVLPSPGVDQRGEDHAVCPVEPGPRTGPAQHGDFMPQHEQFGVLGGR